jgi:hypothetical protein
MMPETERAMDALRAQEWAPHLCGSGPSFFMTYAGGADFAEMLGRRVRDVGFVPMPVQCLPRERALQVERV